MMPPDLKATWILALNAVMAGKLYRRAAFFNVTLSLDEIHFAMEGRCVQFMFALPGTC